MYPGTMQGLSFGRVFIVLLIAGAIVGLSLSQIGPLESSRTKAEAAQIRADTQKKIEQDALEIQRQRDAAVRAEQNHQMWQRIIEKQLVPAATLIGVILAVGVAGHLVLRVFLITLAPARASSTGEAAPAPVPAAPHRATPGGSGMAVPPPAAPADATGTGTTAPTGHDDKIVHLPPRRPAM